MKKIISLILCMGMLMMFGTVKAEEKVEGLHEKLSALFLVNNFTDEEIAEMKKQRDEYIDNKLWPGTLKYYRSTVANAHKTDEELYDEYTDMLELDFESGLITHWVATTVYSQQYAIENRFSYLLANDECWGVPSRESLAAVSVYENDGAVIDDVVERFGSRWCYLRVTDEMIEFLNNEPKIADMILSVKETRIDDLKIVILKDCLQILYIKCGENEYGIKLFDNDDIPIIEAFKIYKLADITKAFEDYRMTISRNYTTPIKPTYETEATALQSEGLLHGNENGLDLLKPLTRIEAAAMLLRALGESETAETDSQVFTDVPKTHWGYGVASAASSLGLVKGVGDNMFAPDKQVTAAEFSTMVLRAANEPEFNWEQAVEIMIEKGILTEETAEPMKLFTRGDMAKIIYEVRNSGMLN